MGQVKCRSFDLFAALRQTPLEGVSDRVKGQDERHRTAPLTPPLTPTLFYALTTANVVIHGMTLTLGWRRGFSETACRESMSVSENTQSDGFDGGERLIAGFAVGHSAREGWEFRRSSGRLVRGQIRLQIAWQAPYKNFT